MRIPDLILGIIQLVILILGKKFENDAAKKKKQEAAIEEVKDAIKTRDTSALNLAISRLHK